MSLPEQIDYSIDHDEDDANDDCIEEGPHAHWFPVLRFLAGVNLLLLALWLLTTVLVQTTDVVEAAYWQRTAMANEFEHQTCVSKHATLLKQIRNEGLWTRLGMSGQPWLQ